MKIAIIKRNSVARFVFQMLSLHLLLLFNPILAKVGSITAEDPKHPLKTTRSWVVSPAEKLKDHVTAIRGGISDILSALENHSPSLTLGAEKGNVLEKIISQFVSAMPANEPVHVLELGSHLGDGSLRILKALGPREGTLMSTEPLADLHSIGSQIVRHALANEPTHRLTYLPMMHPDDLDDFVDAAESTHGITAFHIVFMDHGDHTTFHDDLESLVAGGMLAPGAKIISDNALTKKEQKKPYFDAVKALEMQEEVHEIGLPYKDALHVATWHSHDDGEL